MFLNDNKNCNINEQKVKMEIKQEQPANNCCKDIETKLAGDSIFDIIGNFGKWQLRLSLLMALLKLPIAWFQLGNILLAPKSDFYCEKPNYLKNISNTKWQTFYHMNSSYYLDSCKMPNLSVIDSNFSNCQAGYVYNRSQFESSIIMEWDLVCDNEWLVNFSQMILMIGVLLGNVIFGVTADRYGRKSSLIFAIIGQSICGILMALAPTYWLFTLVRFLLGIANGGTMIISFVLCMEVVGNEYRAIVPILYQIPFGLGTTMMAVLGYWLRDWRELQMTLSALSILFLLNYWFCSESPRWLLVTGKREKAYKLLEKICQINNRSKENIQYTFEQLLNFENNNQTDARTKNANFGSIFKIGILLRRTLLIYLNWFINGMTFFAFSLHMGSVGSTNPWLTVGISGLGVIPGAILCIFCIQRLGRKISLILSNMIIILNLIFIQFMSENNAWIKILLVTLTVVALAVSIPALYLYTGELFPTVIRNAGVGIAAMFSRIGSLLSPLVLAWGTAKTGGLSEEYWIHGPPTLIILAVLAALQAILIIPLPETKNKPLPDTIEQIINK